jgi:methionyl aminopeptidase
MFNKDKIIYKSPAEIEIMREAAQIVSRTLGKIAEVIKEGVTPKYLDELAEDYIRSQNAIPGFKGLYGCPSTVLISVNEQVVHGLPTERPFQSGDIVQLIVVLCLKVTMEIMPILLKLGK